MEDSKRVKYLIWGCVAGAMLSLILMVSTCKAQLNGNFNRVRLVPSTTETGTTARDGTMIYNSTTEKFRFYENGAWSNLNPTTTEPVDILQALGANFKAQSIPVNVVSGTGVLILARVEFISIYLYAGTVVNGVSFFVNTAGNYTAADSNKVGLYSYSSGTLTRVAQSVSDATLYSNLAQKNKDFQTPYTVPVDGVYYVALLWNRSAAVTDPSISGGPTILNINLTLPNSGKLYATLSSQTDLPASVASSGLTLGVRAVWVAVY